MLYAASTSIAAIYSRWQGVLAVIVTFGSVAGLVASEQARRRIMTTVTANAGRPAHRLGTPP